MAPPTDPAPVRASDYAALSAGWGALLGAVLLAARDKGDEPVRSAEVLPLGLAAFALSKLIAKEKVDAWVREPFVEEHPEGRRPRGTGVRYAVGEMLTCTRCVGVWTAPGLTALRVTRPREARMVNAVLGASAINDVAQAGFTVALLARERARSRRGACRRADRAALQPAGGWRMTGRRSVGSRAALRGASKHHRGKEAARGAPGQAARTGAVLTSPGPCQVKAGGRASSEDNP